MASKTKFQVITVNKFETTTTFHHEIHIVCIRSYRIQKRVVILYLLLQYYHYYFYYFRAAHRLLAESDYDVWS